MFKSRMDEMLEIKGISYISTPRPGLRRGGAIAANPTNFSLVKLHIDIPHNLEVVWGLLRQTRAVGRIRKIMVCPFSSPPHSKKKNILIDHILTVISILRVEHPDAPAIISCDKNLSLVTGSFLLLILFCIQGNMAASATPLSPTI